MLNHLLLCYRDLLEYQMNFVRRLLKQKQDKCKHPRLPKRAFGEEYSDTCPDCGYYSYCYRIG